MFSELTCYEQDRIARPGGCTEGGHPAPPDSPFVVNPCHDVGVVEGGGSMLQNEDVRIYHTNLLRSQMTPVNNRCVLSIKHTLDLISIKGHKLTHLNFL